jgi:hypothetical protein
MKKISFLLFLLPNLLLGQNLTTSNLPIISLNTQGKTIMDDPRIQATMSIRYAGAGQTTNITDSPNVYNGLIDIEIRGSTSQQFPKKSYSLDTINADGSDNDVSPFGFAKEHNWVLFAPYNDKSLMRDVLAYALARATGRYAVKTQFVELMLNNQYQGVYVFMEKINRDKNRVNVTKMSSTDISGDALTGGYIVKIDKDTGTPASKWTSTFPPKSGQPQRVLYQVDYPTLANIAPEQKAYIQKWITDFETMMSGASYNDTAIGYAKWIDVGSFVDYLLTNEITKNIDAYRLSSYLFKDRDSKGGKLNAGPVWDFNLGFGNADYNGGNIVGGWQVEFNENFSDAFYQPFWWDKLWKETAFRNATQCRWRELRNGAYNKARLMRWIDSTAQVLNLPKERNFAKWNVLGQYVWPNPFVGKTYQEEVNYLKTWLEARINWIDQQLPGQCSTVSIPKDAAPQVFAADVYPNPFSDTLYLRLAAETDGLLKVHIYNLLGQEILSEQTLLQTPQYINKSWNVAALPQGFYIAIVELGTHKKVVKLVK